MREVDDYVNDETPDPELAIDQHALLLDVDGTILDLAPTPREVQVPRSLRDSLARIYQRTRGALAFVSGRPIGELDLLFAPLQLPAIGGHGAELRILPSGPVNASKVVALDTGLKQKFAAIAQTAPGIVVEDKTYALALHYRLAPDQEDFIRNAAASICAELGVGTFETLFGKYVVEIKQAGFNKATAIRELMTYAPFAGRPPIFIGDDTTDEPVFPIIPEFGGIGFSVGRKVAAAHGCFDEPGDVRRWLQKVAAR